MHIPGAPSIVLASASPHGEQSLYPPVTGQILQVGHFFYQIIHFIVSMLPPNP